MPSSLSGQSTGQPVAQPGDVISTTGPSDASKYLDVMQEGKLPMSSELDEVHAETIDNGNDADQ
jgi:hypothetical protein